jgi:aromatic-L-amino-acid/L-tryptophan decarboxylase
VYITEHTHSHIEKGAIALGVGRENVIQIPVDDEFRMRPEALERAIDDDLAVGRRPMCAVATVGTTSTTSSDPVAAIREITRERGVWLHVDAAYAGPAAILPEFRALLDPAHGADSIMAFRSDRSLRAVRTRSRAVAAHVQFGGGLSGDAGDRGP